MCSIENDKSIIEKEAGVSHKAAVTVVIASDSKTITLDDYYDNKESVKVNDKMKLKRRNSSRIGMLTIQNKIIAL